MRLVCPNCSSQYEVDISLFPEEGREVQCSNCEEIWYQYPVQDEPPLRLDENAVAEPAVQSSSARPSQRLKEDEQRELAAAVQEEIAAREGRGMLEADDASAKRKPAPSEDLVPDDEILSQLREQIEKEGGDFEGEGPGLSQKRNLAKAAQSAGIAVEDRRDGNDRRWNLSMDDRDDNDTPSDRGRRARGRGKKKAKDTSQRKGGLAEALRELEATQQRQGLGFRHGFLTAVIITMIGGGVYMFQEDIARSYPPAEPYLAQYNDMVIEGRAQTERLFVEYQPVVNDLIGQAGAMVSDLTSGGDEAAE